MSIQERIIRRTLILSLKVFLSRCMEQVVAGLPPLLGYTPENMEEHMKFLVTRVGVGEAELGKVQYCLLCSYVFF
jgi:hypothetical protein